MSFFTARPLVSSTMTTMKYVLNTLFVERINSIDYKQPHEQEIIETNTASYNSRIEPNVWKDLGNVVENVEL